jgi:hypothetical protein
MHKDLLGEALVEMHFLSYLCLEFGIVVGNSAHDWRFVCGACQGNARREQIPPNGIACAFELLQSHFLELTILTIRYKSF